MAERRIFEGKHSWAEAVSEEIANRLRAAVAQRGRATLVLAGGSTPAPAYRALAARERVPWERIHFFWGDERHVPPDHPDSNFRMVCTTLLEPLGIAPDDPRVHRMPTESSTPDADAALYEQNLRLFFQLGPKELPHFDVVLLGLGEDGHTASLFPDTPALDEARHLVVANPVAKLDSTRLTMTLPALNAARCVLYLVRGSSKAARVAEILEGEVRGHPAARVQPGAGSLIWLLDRAAAGELAEQ